MGFIGLKLPLVGPGGLHHEHGQHLREAGVRARDVLPKPALPLPSKSEDSGFFFNVVTHNKPYALKLTTCLSR